MASTTVRCAGGRRSPVESRWCWFSACVGANWSGKDGNRVGKPLPCRREANARRCPKSGAATPDGCALPEPGHPPWLGDLYAAQHQFSGRSTDRALTLVPMAELLAVGDSDLIVEKDGEGRLYYRLGLRYAPDDLNLDPLDRGFVVQRSYEAVDDPGDVWLDDDGVWHVLAGAQVQVNVTMVNDSRRTNMALVDPMPAGFESLNPALAVTGEIDARRGGAADSWWWWTWYEHQNLRDDRAEAFSSYLRAGTHEYSYVVRATTPGTFVVPPAKAEEIYAPEVFGRSRTDTVIVQDQR